jgi:3-deoxy-D-manno-octulosonic acid kinase
MTGPWQQKHDGVIFGARSPLRPAHIEKIAGYLQSSKAGIATSRLGGRAAATGFDLEGIGPVVLKHYRRGGAISFLNRQKYLAIGKSRGQREYEWLCRVRKMGIPAPEPVAFASTENLFYAAWLITKEITDARTLAEMAAHHADRIPDLMKKVIPEIGKLIHAGVFHVDLHPGNILLDGQRLPYIIDFDKTRKYEGASARLAEKYLRRWKRAVVKHQLPYLLSESLVAGLESFL